MFCLGIFFFVFLSERSCDYAVWFLNFCFWRISEHVSICASMSVLRVSFAFSLALRFSVPLLVLLYSDLFAFILFQIQPNSPFPPLEIKFYHDFFNFCFYT